MTIQLWPVDSLTKVFPDDVPPRPRGRVLRVLAARGAAESAQFALRLSKDSKSLEVRIECPKALDGRGRLTDIRWRRVEYVPVRRPAWYLSDRQKLRSFPSFFPDPLLEPEDFSSFYRIAPWTDECWAFALAKVTISIWLTLRVPEDAAPGTYRGAVEVRTDHGVKRLPLQVEVSPARVPAERTLKLTQWLHPSTIASTVGANAWSKRHWELLAAWGRNLAEHRCNVVMSRLTELLILSRDAAGQLSVDFSRFDRWVRTFQKAGAIGYIEGSWLGGLRDERKKCVLNDFIITQPDGSAKSMLGAAVTGVRARRFLKELLRLLVAHLEAKGWLSIYYQHVTDEPGEEGAAAYRALADLVKELAPELRRLDATQATESLLGAVDVWCPLSDTAEEHRDFFKARQAAGEEVWHYTCCGPNGVYPNRFISQPLLATRVLHWFNFRAGLTGYLHWGYDAWRGGEEATPFTDTEATSPCGFSHLPPGDTHVIYPGPDGTPRDSIRHEMVREGVQDYELLRIIGAARPKVAMGLAKAVLPSLARYETSPGRFRAVRSQLLAQVAAVQ